MLELQTKVCEDYANIPGAHLEVEDAGLVVAAGQVLQDDVLRAGQTLIPVTSTYSTLYLRKFIAKHVCNEANEGDSDQNQITW